MIYTVTVWREPEGGWSASADGLDGAFTAGRSLAEVDRNIRESIAVTLDLPRGAEDGMDIDLRVRFGDDPIDDLVADTIKARQAAERAAVLTETAVEALRRRGVSVRDAAKVLGITSGRVTQLDKGAGKAVGKIAAKATDRAGKTKAAAALADPESSKRDKGSVRSG